MVLPKGLSESRIARIARRPKRRIVPNREACNKIPNRDIFIERHHWCNESGVKIRKLDQGSIGMVGNAVFCDRFFRS